MLLSEEGKAFHKRASSAIFFHIDPSKDVNKKFITCYEVVTSDDFKLIHYIFSFLVFRVLSDDLL